MNTLNIADNIVNLRKKRGVTQEELATFIGVTKASVSKWENGQSMPDILLLPALASYFDVTVDDILGYSPQLSKEQIQAVYKELAEQFTKAPFEEAFKISEKYVKKYYSCYKFLTQICVLWVNHYMLAEGAERQQEILQKTLSLCEHIINDCDDTIICGDAIVMRASVNLFMGNPDVAVDELEDMINPYRLMNQSDGMLIQAYMMKGDTDRADRFAQISMYNHLGSMLNDSIQFLSIHMQDKEVCMETMKRVDKLIEAYALDGLLQHVTVVFYYQAAVVLCAYGDNEKAILRLEKYAGLTIYMLEKISRLHGDDYFDKLDACFEELDLGSQMVREKRIILDSAIEGLRNPAFASIKELPEFISICRQLESAKKRI